MAWATVVMALATIGIGALAYRQWKDSGELTAAAQKAAAAADKFQTSAANINAGIGAAVEKLGAQARATANAANTAKEALHVSERAYIVAGLPTIDIGAAKLAIPLVNNGRIPSGTVKIIYHEATVPNRIIQPSDATEAYWQQTSIQSLPVGNPLSLFVRLSGLIAPQIQTGGQAVIVAGTITYGDGFPNDRKTEWQFCFRTYFEPKSKTIEMDACNPREMIPFLMKTENYPNNEQQEQHVLPN